MKESNKLPMWRSLDFQKQCVDEWPVIDDTFKDFCVIGHIAEKCQFVQRWIFQCPLFDGIST